MSFVLFFVIDEFLKLRFEKKRIRFGRPIYMILMMVHAELISIVERDKNVNNHY